MQLNVACVTALQGIEGVRFKRVIMDEGSSDRSFNPPTEDSFKRLVLCSGKVRWPKALRSLPCEEFVQLALVSEQGSPDQAGSSGKEWPFAISGVALGHGFHCRYHGDAAGMAP